MSIQSEPINLKSVLEEWDSSDNDKTRSDLIGSIVGNLSRKDIIDHLHVMGDLQKHLHDFAKAVRKHYLGEKLFLRGVLEIGNKCYADCLYCQMRRSNDQLDRYQLDPDVVIASAESARSLGISTILIQSGEDHQLAKALLPLIPKIKELGLDIILCLGSLSRETKMYEELKNAGADGYILKFESSHPDLHLATTGRHLHDRMECIDELSSLGFSVGSGFIYGLPSDMDPVSLDNVIADDILLIQQMQFSMCSVSPFISEGDTPFEGNANADLETTLNIIALLRIAEPVALIPSVSALQQLARIQGSEDGQLSGLNAGANVVTINLTPPVERGKFRIYGNERFIVDIDHANSLALRAGLTKTTESSIGAYTLSKQQQNTWFSERYNVPVSLGESVYSLPSVLQCRFINEMAGKTVIDFGCGDGRIAIPLLLNECHVIAIDDSPSAIQRLKDRQAYLEITTGTLECEQISIFDYIHSHSTTKVQGVILSNVLYYFKQEDVLKAFKLSWDLLDDGGKLFISVEIAPRLKVDIPGDGEKYFHHGNQYSYSVEDINSFIDEALGKGICSYIDEDDKNTGRLVSKKLPLPINVLPYDVGMYDRTYSVYEIIITKRG